MTSFAEIQSSYDTLAAALLTYLNARVPADETPRSFRTDYLRLAHPHEEGQVLRFHSLRRCDGVVCAAAETDDECGAGDEVEPIPVAEFLLDGLYSFAAQLDDGTPASPTA
ncbi:MAG: hypothetical protein JNK23_08685 [Opitutaceae bacterium]|nr:hypothetical protein [Opitutaceae bacterium]